MDASMLYENSQPIAGLAVVLTQNKVVCLHTSSLNESEDYSNNSNDEEHVNNTAHTETIES